MLIHHRLLKRPVLALPDGSPGPTPPNTPPVVTITSPAQGASVTNFAMVTFTCTAHDAEDGPLSGNSVQWTSSIDGPIGSGLTFQSQLSVGTHTITASATDWGGLVGSASITVNVSVYAPPSAEYARRFFEYPEGVKDLYPGGNESLFEGQVIADLPEVFLDTTWTPPDVEDVHYASLGNAASIVTAMNAAISAAGTDSKPQWVVVPDGYYPNPGTLQVPTNSTGEWIYVVSESVFNGTFPRSPGQRVKREAIPKMIHLRCTVANNASILRVGDGGHWRFVGFWFDKDPDVTGFHTSFIDTTRSTTDITFDRCIIHGYKFTTTGAVRGNGARGFTILGANQAVIDSATYELGALGGNGSDRGSIACYAGTGPYKLVNNYFESGGINMLIGGASGPNVEKDFEIRQNHFRKDPTTDPDGGIDPGEESDGSRFAHKNLFEIKRGVRYLLEGNIFENSWTDAQTGYGLIFKCSLNNVSGPNESGHITLRYNKVLRANSPLYANTLETSSSIGDQYVTAKPLHHVIVHDNVFESRGTAGSQFAWGMNQRDEPTGGGDPYEFGPYVFHNNGWYISDPHGGNYQQQMRFGGRSTPDHGPGPWVIKDNVFGPAHYGADRLNGSMAGHLAEHEAGVRGWRVEGNVVWATTWMRPAEWAKGGNNGQTDSALYFNSINDYGIPDRAGRVYGPPVPGSRLANLIAAQGLKGPDWTLVEAYTAYTLTGTWPD